MSAIPKIRYEYWYEWLLECARKKDRLRDPAARSQNEMLATTYFAELKNGATDDQHARAQAMLDYIVHNGPKPVFV